MPNDPLVSTLLLFDFDGTLANTFSLIVEAVNALAPDYGYEPLTATQLDCLCGLPARQVLKLMDVSWYRIPELILKVQRYMSSRMSCVNLYPEMLNTLAALKQQGSRMGIITSNSRSNVERVLSRHQCHDFDFIHSSRHLFGKSKSLKAVIKRMGIDTHAVYYIGDETRDIDAARGCGIQSVAVTWGFNKRELLLSNQPDFLIDSVDELRTFLLNIRQS